MAFTKSKLCIFLLSCIFMYDPSALVKTKLKELASKQNIYNLRLFTNDGKYTYYQRYDGRLMLSLNYKVITLHKSKKFDQYYLKLGNGKTRVLIELVTHFHTSSDIHKDNQIFFTKVGSKKIKFVDDGLNPQLHLKDNYISYYNSIDRKIIIKQLDNEAISWSILVKKKINPYYVPKVIMLDKLNILFTSLDSSGKNLLIRYNLQTKKHNIIYKGQNSKILLEICKMKKDIYLGAFSILDYRDSIIYKINSSLKFNKANSSLKFNKANSSLKINKIYQSKSDDIGNLTCTNKSKLYFLKRRYLKNKPLDDAYVLDLKNNFKVDQVSDLSYLTQIIRVGDTIIAPFHGSYFVLSGLDDLTKFDKIEQ